MTDSVIRPFDVSALYEALDIRRNDLGLSWKQVAHELWDLSSELNDRRSDHPINPSTLTNVAKKPRATGQHALFILRWLGRSPESFLEGANGDDPRFALPRTGPDRRLRWSLKSLCAALDERRRQEGLTCGELASVLGCNPGQLTGLRRARFATGIDLAIRIVQWLGRPAADFVYQARW